MSDACKTCRFWFDPHDHDGERNRGMCRRMPPVECNANGDGMWPFTIEDDWCGEHRGVPPTQGQDEAQKDMTPAWLDGRFVMVPDPPGWSDMVQFANKTGGSDWDMSRGDVWLKACQPLKGNDAWCITMGGSGLSFSVACFTDADALDLLTTRGTALMGIARNEGKADG